MKPRLLDLFCGAGGAAMGYARAGFEVVGVDIAPQPHYPFEFIEGDAIDVLRNMVWGKYPHLGRVDAIHASPPCQAYSRATAWRGDLATHPDLIAKTRQWLQEGNLPYVIENVQEARRLLLDPVMLCGSMFDLPVRRHRYFEFSWPLPALLAPCRHRPSDYSHDHGAKQTETVYRNAMGIDWMTVQEARQAIPPAYTEWIGRQLYAAIERAA